MEKKEFDSSIAIPLKDAPLVYLHEQFKKQNKQGIRLQNNWVWYSTEELEAIILAIKEMGKDPTKKGDGVRLYYGIYNKEVCDYLTAIPKPPPNTGRNYSDHIGHNTVFFVPTYEGYGKDEHIDDILPDTVAQLRKDYINNLEIVVDEKFAGGFNVGNICPPPIDCTKSGSNL